MRHEFVVIISKPEIEVKDNKIVKLSWVPEEPILIHVENVGDEEEVIKNHLQKIKLDPETERVIIKLGNVSKFKVQFTKVAAHLQVAPLHNYLRGTHGQTRTRYF